MASKVFKFSPHLKELRIHLCQTGAASEGVREFIKKYYVEIKCNNDKLPILIRECSGVQPRMWARYEFGKESSTSLTNLDAESVFHQMQSLARQQCN